MLTQERVRELFDYDKITGHLTWRVLPFHCNVYKLGDRAGSLYKGRRRVFVDGTRYYTYQIIYLWMEGYVPDLIDHRNRDKSDDSWDNICDSSHSLNAFNSSARSDNTSGHKGVAKSRNGKWRAYITIDGVTNNLGTFAEFEDAVAARKRAEAFV